MPERTIEFERAVKRYGNGVGAVIALDGVTLEVDRAEFVAVTGPSGSGKTTLLNLIAGLDTATSGRVAIMGHDLTSLSDHARSDLRLRHVGFVFQTFNLFPTFTAQQNVAWPRRFLGDSWRDARARAAQALSDVGLGSEASARVPAELAGGEQQRVAIARALVNSPSLLLADEPTGNLDSETARMILELFARLNSERGLTVVLVTHNVAAAAHAGRTIALRDGRVMSGAEPT